MHSHIIKHAQAFASNQEMTTLQSYNENVQNTTLSEQFQSPISKS
jgi:hypothetical protein